MNHTIKKRDCKLIDLTEIAIALLNNNATLFIGTGFSKFLTDNNVPNWLELLFECAIRIDNTKELLMQPQNYSLEMAREELII